MNINPDTLLSIKRIITQSSRFVIIPHSNPDGDAIGSSLGWWNLLLEMGKHPTVVLPNDCAAFLKWLPGASEIITFMHNELQVQQAIEQCDAIICLDFNQLDRIEKLQQLVAPAMVYKILIDHHPNPQDFADFTISHPECTSTAELSYHTIKQLGFERHITKQVAVPIYCGIMTDTGCLSHNTDPGTYYVVAELLSLGIDKPAIHDQLFNTCSEQRLRLQGDILQNTMVVLPHYNAAFIYITLEQQHRYNFQQGDSEGFVNMPLTIKGIRFSAMFTERDDMIKASFRSKGTISANEFSNKWFNGGGHLNAAGGKFQGSLMQAIDHFLMALEQFKENLI